MLQRQKLDTTQVCKRFQPKQKTVKASKATVLPDDYMSRYEKRDDKLDVWRREGISDAALDKFQVFYDGFSDRLVYPIRNLDGKIVNIGGRTLDPDWKEKKLRKYTYFYPFGQMNLIYGLSENLDDIKKKNEIIIFEGAKSVMVAAGWGITNCAALLTSHVSTLQLKILAKLGVRTVFALDKEIDVRKDKNIIKLNQYTHVEYLLDANNLLSEKDSPVDKGENVFRQLYQERRELK